MTEDELTQLRALAAHGDGDAVAQLVELAGERGETWTGCGAWPRQGRRRGRAG